MVPNPVIVLAIVIIVVIGVVVLLWPSRRRIRRIGVHRLFEIELDGEGRG